MLTPTTFLQVKGIITTNCRDMQITVNHGTGQSYSLVELLEDYHRLKMEEAGFKKDDKNREDTIKL